MQQKWAMKKARIKIIMLRNENLKKLRLRIMMLRNALKRNKIERDFPFHSRRVW